MKVAASGDKGEWLMDVDGERLAIGCDDLSQEAGITMGSGLEPLGGPGSPVKPAVYAGGRYQEDRRWVSQGNGLELVDVVVIDNVPSQANRLEAALERLRERLGLPLIGLDLSDLASSLPPNLPRRLSGFRFPHRHADAYLRDATLDGKHFADTEVGREILSATADRPLALLRWFPQALLFGFWQSHLGKKRSKAKLARSWTSEIVGYRPATTDTRLHGIKGDPLNLSIDEAVQFDPNDVSDWILAENKKSGGQRKQESLSEIGHGQVPFKQAEEAPAGVSFAWIEQRATVSFASLRRIWVGDAAENATARALLAALGIVAHAGAFGGSFNLRSGCDLRRASSSWTWLGASSDEAIEVLDVDAAISLFRDCVARAEKVGLPVGSAWATDPLWLKPNDALAKAIRLTYPLEQ